MKIEQMLHGYDNGHRLLASSVLLKNNAEMDAVATMSDWSEYVGSAKGDSSYVTAYPLAGSGYYVIAKTWYAHEMRRPGCVWTHSLLLPFEELNSVDDFRRLESYFKRPTAEGSFDAYSHSLDYANKNVDPSSYQPQLASRRLVVGIFETLVYRSASVCYKVMESESLADACLSVMNVLPQPMIIGVSWCTGSAYMRKLNGQPLLCQFLSADSTVQELSGEKVCPEWMIYVLDGILRGDVNQGQLIRMFVEDIGDSVDRYSAIATVLYTLEDYFKTGTDNEERYKKVIETIAEAFPKKDSGQVIKKLCAAKSFSSKYCSDSTFFYYLATLPIDDVFDLTTTGIEERWRGFVQDNHIQYVTLLSNICESGNLNKWGVDVLGSSVGILNDEDVATIIKTDYHLFSTITLLNPKLLDKVQWMIMSPQEIDTVLPMLLDNRTQGGFTKWEGLFAILLEKGVEIDGRLAILVFAKTNRATSILLDYVNRDASRYVNYVLGKQIEHHTSEILTWLSTVETITDSVAYAIVNAVNEKSETVARAGAKIWRPFLVLEYHSLRSEVYAFLFSLSFNWLSDKDAIELMRMAFYPLHTLQASRKLGYGNWSRIAGYMETVLPWDEWDYCKKMRRTVIKRLKRAGYDKSVLDNFTPDGWLNEQLKRMW